MLIRSRAWRIFPRDEVLACMGYAEVGARSDRLTAIDQGPTTSMLSESIILKHIARQPKRSAGFKQLVRELGLHGAERNGLDALLRKLVGTGALIQDDSDRYALPQAAADKNIVAGRLTMHRDGFGFVIPDAKSLSASLKSRLT